MTKLPLFGMLSQLELGLVSGEVLLGLLLKSPVLKTLAFKVGNYRKYNILAFDNFITPFYDSYLDYDDQSSGNI